jgi:hypothetical protein
MASIVKKSFFPAYWFGVNFFLLREKADGNINHQAPHKHLRQYVHHPTTAPLIVKSEIRTHVLLSHRTSPSTRLTPSLSDLPHIVIFEKPLHNFRGPGSKTEHSEKVLYRLLRSCDGFSCWEKCRRTFNLHPYLYKLNGSKFQTARRLACFTIPHHYRHFYHQRHNH